MSNFKNSQMQPGFCVVQEQGTLIHQAHKLFNSANKDAIDFFLKINSDTPCLRPGQILIVADPRNANQTCELNELKKAKKKVNIALLPQKNSVADFLHSNYDTIAALTSIGDKTTGILSDASERYFKKIEYLLKEIELTYQNQYQTQGSLISQQFFIKRQALFNEIKPLLNKITRVTIKHKSYDNIKHALGLSSRSIVYEWSQAGVGAIKGYSDYINNAARAAKFMKAGGWVSLGFSFLGTNNKILEACHIGRENECKKAAVKEYSNFSLSTGGGLIGGATASTFMGATCVAIGAATAAVGGIACGIVVTAAGSYVGGELGGYAGDAVGNGINYLIFNGE
ncbi:hypothetical protein [Pantoea sp. FN0307]|uniref:hypothetical protein n=1 Tax=unclassified Pantoea TaxID=2630326 RepID=UPI003CF392B2